jgi:hypothetical protein
MQRPESLPAARSAPARVVGYPQIVAQRSYRALVATFRGPLNPSRRTARRDPDQLGLPVSRPSAREVRWVPGDPVHEPPAEVDPDPRPAVLADEPTDPDAATWQPTAEALPVSRPRVRSLLDPAE